MTKAAMKAILTMCPNIKSVIMKSYDGGNDETWLEVLSKSSHQIQALHVLEATFKGPNLCQYLPSAANYWQQIELSRHQRDVPFSYVLATKDQEKLSEPTKAYYW